MRTSCILLSRANLIHVEGQGCFAIATSLQGTACMAVFQDATTNALSTAPIGQSSGAQPPGQYTISFWIGANVAKNTSTTFQLRAGAPASATTVTLGMGLNARITATNSVSASAFYGSTYNSYLRVREFMV